jgi:hypothetical protein
VAFGGRGESWRPQMVNSYNREPKSFPLGGKNDQKYILTGIENDFQKISKPIKKDIENVEF